MVDWCGWHARGRTKGKRKKGDRNKQCSGRQEVFICIQHLLCLAIRVGYPYR